MTDEPGPRPIDTATIEPPAGSGGPPRSRAPLRRSSGQRMFTGVAGGLSDHTGVDVILFRVGFVVLTIVGGAGLALYLALWLLLPTADGADGPLTRLTRSGGGRSTTWWTVLLSAAAVVLAVALLDRGWNGGLLALAAVAGLAYLLLHDNDGPAVAATPASVAVPAAPRRPRSTLGRTTISLAVLTVGVLLLLDRADALSLPARGYLGAALAVVAGGLVVGSVLGRSRGLIFLAIPLTVALIAASSAPEVLRGGMGQRTWAPTSVGALAPTYELGAGEVILDLSAVDFGNGTAQTTVRLGAGDLRVTVPPDVDVAVRTELRAGDVTLFGDHTSGGGDSARRSVLDTGADGPGGGRLELTVRMTFGQLEVSRG